MQGSKKATVVPTARHREAAKLSMTIVRVFIVAGIFLLASCTMMPKQKATHGTSIDQMQTELQDAIATNRKINKQPVTPVPSAVSNALLPAIGSSSQEGNTSHTEQRFSVAANKMAARAFFMSLVEGTSYNMVISPDVTGTISLDLKNVTVQETLEAVRDAFGYEFHRTSYGYEILPPSLNTQIFTINYLNVKRVGNSVTQVSSGQISDKVGTTTGTTTTGASRPPGSSIDTSSEMNFWRDLETTLKTMIGDQNGHSVVVNPQAGVVMVRAFPTELQQVGLYLDRIQSSMNRQVILEAKILEVQLNDQYQEGVNWNLFARNNRAITRDPTTGNAPIGTIQPGISENSTQSFDGTDLEDFSGIFALNIKGDFAVLIKLLQTQGNVQVLSSPRISTVNNQKAIIKVGQDEFFVTNVSSTSSQVGTTTVATPNVTFTPFFGGVTLDVTPQISDDNNIILHIHPTVSTIKDQTKTLQLAGQQNSFPLAQSTVRESDNVVHAKNGQIVVIGGLIQNDMSEETAGVPLLSNAPIIGPLFRRTSQISRKTELIILLRPIIVGKQAWEADLERTDKAFRDMKRGFHAGSLPEVFGNEGEPHHVS